MDAFAEPGEHGLQNDMPGCLKERSNLSPLTTAGPPAVHQYERCHRRGSYRWMVAPSVN
jgi:hypothetical protein